MAYTFKHGDRPLEGVTVQRAVGRGGFGEVYYAVTDSGKQVALKYLRENPDIELRGISHVMNLKSPHLITIYDVKRNAGNEPFVIMEYVGGPSLRELLIAQPGGLGPQKAAFFLQGIAKGLSYLHERGIVHRDLKPANIFYDDGYVKIGDYGLSKHISVSQHSGQTVSVGTVHYMAPEIGSGSYTKAIDIYALGVILFEMLSGHLPYSGSSMAEILMRHLRDNPDLSGIPGPYAKVIAKALAKDPKDRYQDANEMLAAITESGEVSANLSAFDVTSLSQVPRIPEEFDPDQTLTSPRPADAGRPAGAPCLDAREVQPLPPLPEKLQRKLDHLNDKLERKLAKLERRLGPGQYRPEAAGAPPVARPVVRRRSQVFILLVVTFAIAVALGLIQGRPGLPESRVAVIAFLLIGGVVGPLLAHLKLLERVVTRSQVLDRLAYVGLAGLCMAPGAAIATDEVSEQMAYVIVAPLAAILLCDWGQRIEKGRAGQVQGWSAFWPAVVGLVAAHIVDASDYAWTAAGVTAAISLLTQAAASMWPSPRSTRTPIATMGAPVYVPRHAAQPDGTRADVPGDPAPAPLPDADPPPAPPVVVTAAQPSFVGRSANAGISFLGKLLLLVGLAVALGQEAVLERVRHAIVRDDVTVSSDVRDFVHNGAPPVAALLPLVAGSLLLVAARRKDGGAHFFRGCLGCVFALGGAAVAMASKARAFEILLTGQNTDLLTRPNVAGPLAATTVLLGLGLVLLLWPKAHDQTTIVI